MDSNSFCLLLCFLLRPTGSINGNLIFPRRPVASAGTKGSPALVSLFSFFCHCVHLVPLRYPQGFGIGFGHQEPSAAEEMRLRQFICFLWCFNEQESVGSGWFLSVLFGVSTSASPSFPWSQCEPVDLITTVASLVARVRRRQPSVRIVPWFFIPSLHETGSSSSGFCLSVFDDFRLCSRLVIAHIPASLKFA
ncbi:hypothetical protein F2Q69_00004561 [Brassica cretica]|uniref:Secreted protein n=1 Tax=Brassica cretica TaxID=69181 RepID=A0A8S9PI11_BRACR|nr:hypothetical protein F2Q69_00004561 [Brassica cretica]